MSDDWADEVAEAPPSELAPVLPELPQIMLFGERQSVTCLVASMISVKSRTPF